MDDLTDSIQLSNEEKLIDKDETTTKLSIDKALLRKMNEVLEELRTFKEKMGEFKKSSFELKAYTDFSSSQMKTINALSEERAMAATEIASLTNRNRSIETIYLNQLVKLGIAEKFKRNRKY